MSEVIVRRRRLHPGQLVVSQDPHRYRIAMIGRRWGKNVLGIDEAQVAALKGQAVGWMEPGYKYLLEAWLDLTFRLRPAARRISEQDKRIELVTGGVIEMWTLDNPDAGRSRAYDLVIINEAGLCRDLLAVWQQAIRPTLTDRAGRALFLGTPKGQSHDFSLLFRQAEQHPDEWATFRRPTTENPHIPAQEVAAARREFEMRGEPGVRAFLQEYEGVPADDGGNPFGLDAIRACTVPGMPLGEAVAFGWDFARSQDWTVGVGLSARYEVVAFHRWQGIPWGAQEQLIKTKNGTVPAWGDATRATDDAVVEQLQYMGVPIMGFPFSLTSKQGLMQRLVVCIQQHKLRIPEGLITRELETFGYEYTPHGVRYAAPQGLHDDCVMALALAVYGRDQMLLPGDIPEKRAPYDEHAHPGFDLETGQRKRPWYAPQPEVVAGYLPGSEYEELKW